MGDMGDDFRALRERRQQQGEANRGQAAQDFPEARRTARRAGLRLFCHSETHYSLRSQVGWLIDIYPGNRRIRRASTYAPFLRVPPKWTLLDVVRAAGGGQ